MRTRWLVPLIGLVVVAGTALMLRAKADAPSLPSSVSPTPGEEEVAVGSSAAFPVRAVTVGTVDIVIEPIRIDETAAVFRVAMSTHTGELSADLAITSALEVDGLEWTRATWSGDPPGGHHREGELTFEASGPASDMAVLSIGGFSEPVNASWTLTGQKLWPTQVLGHEHPLDAWGSGIVVLAVLGLIIYALVTLVATHIG